MLPAPHELAVAALRREGSSEAEARRILMNMDAEARVRLEEKERERFIAAETERRRQEWLQTPEGKAALAAQALQAEAEEQSDVEKAAALMRQTVPAEDVARMQQDDPRELLYLSGMRERPKTKRETGSSMVATDRFASRPSGDTLPSAEDLEQRLRDLGELPPIDNEAGSP